jgi:amino-acid N-acetyltransferase
VNIAEQILILIEPFVQEGKILPRTYHQIDKNIDDFVLIKESNDIIACAGLRDLNESDSGEIYCMAVKHRFQKKGQSDVLLKMLIDKARDNNYSKIFALSKHSSRWFIKNGFSKVGINTLPQQRRGTVDMNRNSSVFLKTIDL